MIEFIEPLKIINNIQKFEKNFFPYDNVDDKQIKYYLETKNFIDVSDGHHNGYMDSSDIHAQRIASIVNLINNNVNINPVIIYNVNGQYEIDDGHHRLRAYHFINKNIPVIFEYEYDD